MADGTRMQPDESFVPGPDTRRLFRDGLGRFASGVTVVTAATSEGGIGMTANSFTSVSLDPPLVLWCPSMGSARYPVFAAARQFVIHVLAAGQEEVAMAFARSATAFEGLSIETDAHGVPILEGCLARFHCDTHALHEAGDHAIMLGRVRSASFRSGAPLVFSQGRFGRFDKQA